VLLTDKINDHSGLVVNSITSQTTNLLANL